MNFEGAALGGIDPVTVGIKVNFEWAALIVDGFKVGIRLRLNGLIPP